jgi:capsular polysaccharide biosynthesis protein
VAGRQFSGVLERVQRRLGGGRSDRQLLAAIVDALPQGSCSVVLLNSEEKDGLARRIRRARPESVIHDLTGNPSDRHVRLTLLKPVDLIVDEHPGQGQAKRFLASFYQLRPGGAMVLRDWKVNGDHLRELLDAAREAQGQPYPSNKRGILLATLDAHGLGTVLESTKEVGSHLVVVSRGGPILAKLREDEMNHYLAGLPAGGDRVLEVIPAEPFHSRCVLRENTESRRANYPVTYDTIDLNLRLYHDMVVTPGQVLSNDRVLTPDTYRHNQFPRLRNRYTEEVAPRFARLRHETTGLPRLEGTYFHLDNEIRGHFGHLVTEQMSRFWGWSRAKEFDPTVKAVVAINKGHELRTWESEIYAAAGIAADDVVFLREPARLERVISGTPMLSNPNYIHPAIADTWRMVGDNLAASAADLDFPERFFCSRRLNKRSCHNTPEVEELFAAQGFEIVFPEDYSLGEQVKLFRNARIIGGFAGSGLFNLCYATQPKRVIMISSTAYTARNEYLFASVLGHRIDSVVCVPDDPTFYQSPFTFDPHREGEFLAGVFASL